MRQSIAQGVLYMLLAIAFLAFMNACVKLLYALSPMEIVFFRHFITMVCIALFWSYLLFFQNLALDSKNSHFFTFHFVKPHTSESSPQNIRSFSTQLCKKKGGLHKLLFRSITGGLAMLALFYNISSISLGTASAFAQTMPLYVVLFCIILRQRVSWLSIVASIIGFVGVLLICDPALLGLDSHHISSTHEVLSPSNIIAGIFNGAMMALAYMSIKNLSDYYSESAIIMGFALFMCLVSGIIMCFEIPNLSGFILPNAYECLLLLLVGCFGTLGQVFLTRAFMLAPAGLISPLNYIGILWGVGLGVLLGDDLPSNLTLGGMGLIILSGLLIALPVFLKEIKHLCHRL